MQNTTINGQSVQIVHLCSSCGRTRSTHGEWRQNLSTAPLDQPGYCLSHGLCPACARLLYPELFSSRHETASLSKTAAE